MQRGMTRREVLRTGVAGAAAVAVGSGLLGRNGEAWADDGQNASKNANENEGPPGRTGHDEDDHHDDDGVVERSIGSLQRSMRKGELTAVDLVTAYVERIARLDKAGPTVNSIIEVNPDALAIAAALDRERRRRGPRGPLHGIPIVVKDNIATADGMQTTAGSLALVGAKVPADAALVANLRKAGAIVLAKTNLSEWANFRSFNANSGWSGRGGLTVNPYLLTHSACGSSSGSGAAVAASFAAAAVGTETDGSITCPAALCGIVGIKPTQSLMPGAGIVPLAHSQDTAGPMGRTVADVAALLPGLTGERADTYTRRLRKGALRGARIGVARQFFGTADDPFTAETAPVWDTALAALREAGAVLVDPVDVPNVDKYFDTELTVLLYEFKADINAYLAGLVSSPVRSLADLIAFDNANAATELKYFDQSIFDAAEATTDLRDPVYLDALATDLRFSRGEGIDQVLREQHLDALVWPTSGPAWKVELGKGDTFNSVGTTSPPAVAGYPHVTVPAGFDGPLPLGFSIVGPAGSDARMLAYAYAFEQTIEARRPPQYLGTRPG